MFKVYVWVPTKGWRKVASVKTAEQALEAAESFEPLEVKVERGKKPWKTGQVYYGGNFCEVNYKDELQPTRTLDYLVEAK